MVSIDLSTTTLNQVRSRLRSKRFQVQSLTAVIVKNGEYWRLLTPGTYEVLAAKEGFEPDAHTVVVTNADSEAVRTDFNLRPVDNLLDAQVMPSNDYFGYKSIPDNIDLNNPEVLRLINFLQRVGAQNERPVPN